MKKALLAALAMFAFAVAAAPAVAQKKVEPPNPHKFVGSENVEPKFTGESQEFALKPFTVTCETAKSKNSGAATFPSKTLTAVVKYSHCEAAATIGKAEYELKAKFTAPVTLNYHANGYVELGSGGTIKEGKLEGAGAVEIAVKGAFKCTIDIAAGTYPAAALKKPEAEYTAVKYTNKEETIVKGKKTTIVKTLGIENTLTKLPYEIEGEFCEALPKTEFGNGTYTGSLVASIKNATIGWE